LLARVVPRAGILREVFSCEKRDLRRHASSFPPVRLTQTGVIAAYWLYASFLRIRPPCISSFLTGLPVILFINELLSIAVKHRSREERVRPRSRAGFDDSGAKCRMCPADQRGPPSGKAGGEARQGSRNRRDLPAQKIGVYEIVQVSVQNGVHITSFIIRPVILHQMIGLQNVRAYLASPCDFLLVLVELFPFFG